MAMMELDAIAAVVLSATVTLLGCGSSKSEPAAPKEAAHEEADTGGDDPLHAALVDTHKTAVEECFGGFGKGAPYSAKLRVDGRAVTEAAVEPLSEGHGELPRDCIAKHFRAMAVPASVDSTQVHARFAVQTDDCAVPACGERDLPCQFKRDIACSVVIDER
jgi:hypothetical protein